MPTTLPLNYSALSYIPRQKLSARAGVSLEIVILSMWSMAMLAVSLLAVRHGVSIETFNSAF